MNGFPLLALLAALALLSLPAVAARPFVTDDARLTTAGSCQLESWMRVYPQSREAWALPACNPGDRLEFTFGGGQARNSGEAATQDYLLQLKTLIKPLETNGWGWGIAAGSVHHPDINPGPNLLGNTYIYLPLSASFADDRVVIHHNLGWLKDKASGDHRLTWGVGGEFQLHTRLSAIAEAFGDNRNGPFWQAGVRLAIVPDRIQLDATYGRELHGPGDSRWLSFGLRLTPDRLF